MADPYGVWRRIARDVGPREQIVYRGPPWAPPAVPPGRIRAGLVVRVWGEPFRPRGGGTGDDPDLVHVRNRLGVVLVVPVDALGEVVERGT